MQKKLTYDEWVEMYGPDPLERAALINQNTELSRRCFTLKCELNRTKRALWLARAERALMSLEYFTLKCRWFKDYMKIEPPQCDVSMIKKWARVNRKCRAYADKFKEVE